MFVRNQPIFENEKQAHEYLADLLDPFFRFEREVRVRHILTGNNLRIDFLVTPNGQIDFPFGLFGIEAKASTEGIGQFNRAIKQAIDYTFCEVVDKRERLIPVLGDRLDRVYVFPAPNSLGDGLDGYYSNWHGGSERLAGLFRVGLIYMNHLNNIQFRMSAERQWDPDHGGRKAATHTTNRVGSGVVVSRS
jgi:hypothetical protein